MSAWLFQPLSARGLTRRLGAALELVACLPGAAICAAPAPAYPSRPIRFIVPGTPGASTAVLVRVTGQKRSGQFSPWVMGHADAVSTTATAEFC